MRGVITAATLGTRGRFGNSLFQMAALMGIARAFDYELQLPSWIGDDIFETYKNPIKKQLTPVNLDELLVNRTLGWWLPRLNGHDLVLYGQHQSFLHFYTRKDCLDWFKLKPEFLDLEDQIKAQGPYSVCHLRRGDFTNDFFSKLYCIVTDDSYRRAIEKFKIPEPIYWVTEGWRKPNEELEKRGLGFVEDFLIVKNATHILRSNSTFGFWAAALSNAKVYSPVVEAKVGWSEVDFVEGNAEQTANFTNQSRLELREI